MTIEAWPRARNWYLGPLQFFRNPDAGVTFGVWWSSPIENGAQFTELFRIGPGQCGERTWNRNTNPNWCYRAFGHDGSHAYTVAEALR